MTERSFFENWLKAWSKGDAEQLLGYYHPQGYYQDPACPQGLQGHAQMHAYFTRLLKAYPGWTWSIDTLFPGEAGWTLRWNATWAEPWRKPLQGMDWIELRDGLISRNEVWFDTKFWPERAYSWDREGFTVSTDKQRLERERLLALLQATYWSANITPAQLEQRIETCVCFGLYAQGELIGFARALTDYHGMAYLADVIVASDWRGQGLGTWLVDCALQHTKLKPMRRWLLKTRDAHGVYHKLGFHPPYEPDGWLELLASDVSP
ncbi:MAG TPA: GNAT family N-acetyltransferase [Candidatus Obscuribacterales bacterium]